MVNTKQVTDRREIHYATLDELAQDLDAIERAANEQTLSTVGNWSAGQILQHLARFTACSLDGFPGKGPPAPLRWVFILLFKKKALSGEAPPPGFKIPNAVAYLRPDDDVPLATGLEDLRAQIHRVREGAEFIPASPVFGKLTRDQWITINLGHARMHTSFIKLG